MTDKPVRRREEFPEGWRRQMQDGIGTWQASTDSPDERWYWHSVSFEEMEAMTPEQREYYGLTADYQFALEHPAE